MKKVVLGITIGLVVTVIAALSLFRAVFVYIDGKFYERRATWFGLNIIDMSNTSIWQINRCKNLEMLYTSHMDSLKLKQLYIFENLTNLTISEPDSALGTEEIEKLNLFPSLSSLSIQNAEVDLTALYSGTLEKLEVSDSNVTVNDLKLFANCPALKKLDLYRITMDDRFIFTEDDSLPGGGKYTLTDSACLSDLDSVKRLALYQTYIDDISGILDMDSLEELWVAGGFLTDEQTKLLEDKGVYINVIG